MYAFDIERPSTMADAAKALSDDEAAGAGRRADADPDAETAAGSAVEGWSA